MKILVALDTEDYSNKILKNVARLAGNTLADIIFLGIQEGTEKLAGPLADTMLKYQQDLASCFNREESPYADFDAEQWQEKQPGDWYMASRGMKEFTLRIRSGSIVKEVLSVARETECDLIILGCNGTAGCEWNGEWNVPLRIAEGGPCSVLVIKDVKRVKQIVSILDQSAVSQEAMELINQLVTLNDSGLNIVGVKGKNERKETEIEQRIVDLLRYYNDRKISTWIKLINSDDVQDYVTGASVDATVALWMGGKQSLLKKIFSRTMVEKLLETSGSSLLILR
ncbi:MAG TPA: hypothetical protein EYP35_11160 [Desulfobacterales bacterium]|nr:hypothetical protein [Desulfobacterales bacterium]